MQCVSIQLGNHYSPGNDVDNDALVLSKPPRELRWRAQRRWQDEFMSKSPVSEHHVFWIASSYYAFLSTIDTAYGNWNDF